MEHPTPAAWSQRHQPLPWLPTSPPAPAGTPQESAAAWAPWQGQGIPELDSCGCASSSPAPRIPGGCFAPCCQQRARRGSTREASALLLLGPSPRFSFLGCPVFPGQRGLKLPQHFVQTRPFPSRTLTHTSVLGTQSSVHTFPWPECSNLIRSISWKGEGKTAPGVMLLCPWHHPGARMALEAQSFLCIS